MEELGAERFASRQDVSDDAGRTRKSDMLLGLRRFDVHPDLHDRDAAALGGRYGSSASWGATPSSWWTPAACRR